ncbi:MAG: nucleotidyltransferase domain-containing protein [Bacteroidia bacterium]|nr:nucleotidyltransferase domain-containing protein [Bacteroidia bacterium]
MNLFEQHKTEITNLCKQYKVQELYAFGSVLNENRFNEQSDIDLIVKFNNDVDIIDYVDLFFGLIENLERVFKRKVDLYTLNPIENRFLRENIESTKQIVYAA